MTRFRLDLAYDGTDFHGWASQPGPRTVQGELQTWIGRVLRLAAPVELTVAGRTDAGVHASGQVAHVDLEADDPAALAAVLGRRLNRALPPDLVVNRVSVAHADFDARFAAIWRRYRYRMARTPVDPLQRHLVAGLRQPFDAAAADAAADRLIGLHDFAAFCRHREGASTIRNLQELSVMLGDTGVFEVEVRADAFCHSMVRSLVGALVRVGSGDRDADWLESLLGRRTRCGEIPVMPAHGLVLEEVRYPPDDQLAARQMESRARRDS